MDAAQEAYSEQQNSSGHQTDDAEYVGSAFEIETADSDEEGADM
jgi:hypothetical protein